jgi:hypothetical protein
MRKYAIWEIPISEAIDFKVSARSWSSLPRIVSVSRSATDSTLMWTSLASLRFNIEDPEHYLISRMSDHPARLRIYSTGNVAA